MPQLRIKRQRRRSGFGKLQREAARRRRTDRRLALASFLSLLGLLVLCYRLLVARGA